jgi:hypothetical protein
MGAGVGVAVGTGDAVGVGDAVGAVVGDAVGSVVGDAVGADVVGAGVAAGCDAVGPGVDVGPTELVGGAVGVALGSEVVPAPGADAEGLADMFVVGDVGRAGCAIAPCAATANVAAVSLEPYGVFHPAANARRLTVYSPGAAFAGTFQVTG